MPTKVNEKGGAFTNIYEKLQKAREIFLQRNVKQSGKNTHMRFMYYELKDLVPEITEIFTNLNLTSVVNVYGDHATLTIYDLVRVDLDTEHIITFTMPIDASIQNSGTNAMQSIGAAITYARRYLYMLALDIIEPDSIDVNNSLQAPSAQTRAEIKSKLTNPEGQADKLQLKALQDICVKVSEKYGSKYKDDLNATAKETNKFTSCTKERCTELIKGYKEVLDEVVKE